MTGRELRPTHTCFDDALGLLEAWAKEEGIPVFREPGLFLVHGIATSPAGEPYAHAWVERAGNAWQAGLLDGVKVYYVQPLGDFMASHRIREHTKYTPREAVEENWSAGHYGPWRPEYAALCGEDKRVLGQSDQMVAVVGRSTAPSSP